MIVVDDSMWAEYIEVHHEMTPYVKKIWLPYIREVVSYFYEIKSYRGICCFFYRSWSNYSERNKCKLTEPSKFDSNKRNSVGPDNPKGSKISDMDQNQKNDPYSIANYIVALNQRLYNWRKTFVSMKMEKRLSWLKAMIPRKTSCQQWGKLVFSALL